MTLYLESQCGLAKKVLCTSWSHHSPPLVAVGLDDGSVSIFDSAGSDVEGAKVSSRYIDPSSIAFCPAPAHALVVGWKDGAITYTEVSRRASAEVKEAVAVHASAAVTFTLWSLDGARLLSTDASGGCGIWKISGGKLELCHKFTVASGVSYACYIGQGAALEHRFAVGCDNGCVLMLDDSGKKNEVFSVDAGVACLLWSGNIGAFSRKAAAATAHASAPPRLICVGKNMSLAVFNVSPDGRMSPITQGMRLGANLRSGDLLSAFIHGASRLVVASGEPMLRVFNVGVDDGENYVLSIADHDDAVGEQGSPKEVIHSASLNPRTSVIAAVTDIGRVLFWRACAANASAPQHWTPLPSVSLKSEYVSPGAPGRVAWAPTEAVVCVGLTKGAFVLREGTVARCASEGTSVAQLSSNKIVCDVVGSTCFAIEKNVTLRGCCCTQDTVYVWSASSLWVHDTSAGEGTQLPLQTPLVAAHGNNFYTPSARGIEAFSRSGVPVATLEIDPNDGRITVMSVCGRFLVAATNCNALFLWDVSRREAKWLQRHKNWSSGGDCRITGISCSLDGKYVSILSERSADGVIWTPDSRVCVWFVDTEAFHFHDVGAGVSLIAQFWDAVDARLLAVHCIRLPGELVAAGDVGGGGSEGDDSSQQCMVLLFASVDRGVIVSDTVPFVDDLGIVGIHTPHTLVLQKPMAAGGLPRVVRKAMRDYEGVDMSDDKARAALMEFSFNLTIGNLDDSYKAIKMAKTAATWRSMATICIRHKRLDVAEVCLGYMGNILGVRAIRESAGLAEADARLAAAAVHLGMIDEAERLYRGCGRYDLLNKLYISQGRMDKALETSQSRDRLHMRTILFHNARHKESCGDLDGSIKAYEQAGVHCKEVPRMLWEKKEKARLEEYCKSSSDPQLTKWWAQYCESLGRFDDALAVYVHSNDIAAQVKVLSCQDNLEAAKKLAVDSGNALACFHVAKQLEYAEQEAAAIEFFGRAGKFNHAVRIAKAQHLDDQLLSLALQAPVSLKLDVAEYFEKRNMNAEAVLLLQKAGHTSRAIDLCFRHQLFDKMQEFAGDVNVDGATDPVQLMKVAAFFVEHKKFDKAAAMLVSAKQFDRTIDMCEKHSVKMTEDMAEKLTACAPTKEENAEERARVLRRLAKLCKQQGLWTLATKKFTQAGAAADKEEAMECLIKSSDPDKNQKIMFFAATLKMQTVFVMAANYLQTLDWHSDGEILKNIVAFYTKAKAFDNLSLFYDACAQVEVDDYRDYDKALGALSESLKYATMSQTPQGARRSAELEKRMQQVAQFVNVRTMHKTDPQGMISQCHRLLATPDIEAAVRVGDVYALLTEWHFSTREFDHALKMIQGMQKRRIDIGLYLDSSMVAEIYKANGIQVQQQDDGLDEEIEGD